MTQHFFQTNDLENQLAQVMEGKEVTLPQPMTSSSGTTSTQIVGSTKTKTRVAHMPSMTSSKSFLNRPIVEPDSQAKVPSNVRQRYLNR